MPKPNPFIKWITKKKAKTDLDRLDNGSDMDNYNPELPFGLGTYIYVSMFRQHCDYCGSRGRAMVLGNGKATCCFDCVKFWFDYQTKVVKPVYDPTEDAFD